MTIDEFTAPSVEEMAWRQSSSALLADDENRFRSGGLR